MSKTAGSYLIAGGVGLAIGVLIGRASRTRSCPPCGPGAVDTRPGLQKIAAGFRDICETMSPVADQIEQALADDRRIDANEAYAIMQSLGRLM
jgi:hypothetical protein